MITRHGNSTYPTWPSFIIQFKRSLLPLVLVLIAGLCGQMLLSAPMLAQQPRLTVGTATGGAGSNVDVTVSFTAGATGVASMNFDLTLPTGVSYVSFTLGSAASAAGKTASGASTPSPGVVRVLLFGMNQTAIGSGPVAILTLNIAAGTSPGSLPVGITGWVFSDAGGNGVTGTATGGSVTVSVPADTTPPIISAVGSSSVTATGATITWTTNEASDSQVDYGTTAGYGTSTTLNATKVTSHSAALSGLTASTLYHYRVKSKDASANLATSGDFTFTTSAPPDTTPPIISAVGSSSVTATGATITWTTNEASDSQVDYGTTAGYGTSTTLNASLVTSHSTALSGLTGSTLYHYRVKSKDASANLATSGDFTFTTSAPPDTTPPIISAVGSSSVTASGATISWTTNEASDSQVDYGTTAGYGTSTTLNATKVTSHSAALSGLTASTLYHYRVKSRDAAGNLATSGDFTFTTSAPPDTTPPIITAVGSSSVTASGATITWTTNEASDSQVDYGTTAGYGTSTTLNASLVTSHSAALSGLTASTLYHYRVKSKDAAGNLATSGDFTFTTTAPPDTTPPVISIVAASSISSSGATITWTTNEASDSQVDYGTTAGYGTSTTLNASMVTSHSAGLTGLTGSTLYHYRVKSRDAAGNLATSGDFNFTTSATPDTTPPLITGVNASSLTSSGAVIAWTTNEAGDSQVEFGTTAAYGNSSSLDAAMVTGHSQALTGLTASTLYHCRVKSKDAAGNLATSGDFTFNTTAAADTTPPSVPANLAASAASATQVNLSWSASTDNVAVTGYRIYRNGSPVGTSATPSYQDSGLTASTTYSYTVSAYDAANNSSAPSSAATATTGATADTTPPLISSERITSVGATTATMNWMTNEVADSQVEYGTTIAYGNLTPVSPSLVTAHSIGMTVLKADTLYHCRVRSRDAAGNLAFSEDYTFTTTTETPTNQTCSQGFGQCYEAMVPAGGGLSQVSSGQGDLSVLYGVMNSSGTSWPVALANFGFTQDGVLVTEVGVPASAPFTSTRLFVDYGGPSADSGVAMVNPNDTPIVVNADLRNQRGEFVSSSSISLEAKGHTAQFVSQLITNIPNPFLGTLTLSSASPFAAVNLRLASNGHGETLFSALPLADLSRSLGATRLIFPQVVDGGGLPTQILLMNPSVNTTSTGFISFFDDEGNALALDFGGTTGVQSSLNYSLAPNGMVKYSTTGLGALRVGYAVVTPLSGFAPVGSGIFSINGNAGLASQAGVPNAVETTSSRLFVERATDPLPRDTGVAIVNRNLVEAQITLTLVGMDGSTQSGSLTVPANGHVARFVSELFPGLPAQYQGVLTMTSPVPLAAMTLRQTFNQRNDPIYSTLPVADLTRPPEGPLYIPQFADGGGYQTQLILINTSNSSSLIQIEFFNDHGVNINMLLK